MKVVFDTNPFVCALVFPAGAADQALGRILQGTDRLLVSNAINREVLGVRSRKFNHDREELSRVAVFLDDLGKRIESTPHRDVLEDEPDNRILECAVSGEAGVMVTGDKAMLRLGTHQDVAAVSLRDYLW